MELPFHIQMEGPYRFIDEGPRATSPPILLLHGMLGNVGNWSATAATLLDQGYRIVIPLLPVYGLALSKTSVPGLVEYVHGFSQELQLGRAVVAGNSLGGHVALLYALTYPDDVAALVLSGSSGIYEVELGTSTPRRRDRAFIRERAALTFFDPVHATDEIVDEMHELLGDRARVARLIKMARSTKAETLTDRLHEIKQPTLLIWGRNDRITPPDVAYQFKDSIPRAKLHFIDQCGHAPMVERPREFNRLM
ncbi:MAG: alpha/beta fold hydrolase, partial [Rhodothermales bacterium]